MLNEKERLLRAMRRQPVDRPPFVCPGGMMNLVTRDMMDAVGTYWPACHTNAAAMAKLAAAAGQIGCFENIGLPFCMTVEAEAMGAQVDMGNLTCEPHVTGYAICSVADWQNLQPMDCKTGRAGVVLDAITALRGLASDLPIIGNLTGPISVASSLMEPTVFYKELRKKPKEAQAYIDFVCQNLTAFGLAQLRAGADVIAISDPSGTGEILGPKLFAKYVVPALNSIITALKDAFPTCEVLVHICGKMHTVYEPLKEIACNTLSFDAVVKLREARQALPRKVLMGNMSTYALEFSTPEKIQKLAQSCLAAGTDILAPACGLGANTAAANLQATLAVLQETGEGHGV